MRAARLMHGGMVRAVLRAKVSWFEATPLGRVLNRFSSDISQIDQMVAGQFKDTVVMAFNVTGIALVRGREIPTLLTTLLTLLLLYSYSTHSTHSTHSTLTLLTLLTLLLLYSLY